MQPSRRDHSGSTTREAVTLPLAGRRVLLVEDEALVALDLEMTLQSAGATVVGPFLRLADAMRAVRSTSVDLAVLDLMMGRDDGTPLADILHEMGVAVVFHTGHAAVGGVTTRYPGAGHCPKPCSPATIIRTLGETLARRAS